MYNSVPDLVLCLKQQAVQQVLSNLLISHIEIRTEESIDIKRYSHERKVDKIVVPLGDELSKAKEKYIQVSTCIMLKTCFFSGHIQALMY